VKNEKKSVTTKQKIWKTGQKNNYVFLLQFIIKLEYKEGKESFRFEYYLIRDDSTVEAAIIKQNNLKTENKYYGVIVFA
jgi:hypothetical protein